MAQQSNKTDCDSQPQQIQQWLKESNLIKMKTKLQKHDITMKRLKELAFEYTVDQLKLYMLKRIYIDPFQSM